LGVLVADLRQRQVTRMQGNPDIHRTAPKGRDGPICGQKASAP
jgi:hypothetical protein